MQGKLRIALILFLEIAGLTTVFIVFLLILNFFNIISLSKMYPSQLGFLPHRTTSVNKVNNSIKESLMATPAPNLQNLQSQYLAYANKNLKGPQFDAKEKTYSITGAYLSTANDMIQIVTAVGTINFQINSLTTFQTYNNRATFTSGSPYLKSIGQGNFVKDLKEGTLIQVDYLYGVTNPKAIRMTAANDFAK